MRYRILSDTDDYVFGSGSSEFLVDSPATVAQAVKTRLLLATGEWFLNLAEGTPYSTEILGMGTQELYDQAIRERILSTPGVVSIDKYFSSLDAERHLAIDATINTQFGVTTVQQVL